MTDAEKHEAVKREVETIVTSARKLYADIASVSVKWADIPSDVPLDIALGLPKVVPEVTITFHKP